LRRSPSSRLIALSVAALVVVSGCSVSFRTSGLGGVGTTSSAPAAPTARTSASTDPSTRRSPTVETTARSTGDMQNTSETATPGEANDVVEAAIEGVERYWEVEYPKLSGGKPFEPVKGGYHPYTKSSPPPACGQERSEYEPNAFYCSAGDFIAWDSEVLIPEFLSDFGPLLVGLVVAHEYGHAIQSRLGLARQPTIVLEQQADCFGGAWVGDADAGSATVFGEVTPQQLDTTLAGLLQLRDQPGTAAQDPRAHGNAFDRIRAFQDGVEGGAQPCAAYRAGNLEVTEMPFSTRQDAATGGELPSYQDAVTVLTQSLQSYWAQTYPELNPGQRWTALPVRPFDPSDPPACEGRVPPDPGAAETAFYCTSGDYAAFDAVRLGPALYRRIGDNAVGMLLGGLFAQAAQVRRGQPPTGRAGQLEVDCLAGSWTNSLLNASSADQIRLSPGDLDEGVAALLAFNRTDDDAEVSGFDRIASYRTGVLGGLPACS
jgi:predicted metalloprotease